MQRETFSAVAAVVIRESTTGSAIAFSYTSICSSSLWDSSVFHVLSVDLPEEGLVLQR
jgi:hypothetical protein